MTMTAKNPIQILHRPVEEICELPLTLPCVLGHPNKDPERVRIITVEAPVAYVATLLAEGAGAIAGGFQRPLQYPRAKAIADLMVDNGVHVHGGLLAYGEPGVDLDITQRGPNRGQQVVLRRPLKLLDGQHRAGGAQIALTEGANYTECLRIITGASHEEVVRWYMIANAEARKAPPSNAIWNASQVSGVAPGRKKSWIARLVVELADQAPFRLQGVPLVSWRPDDIGRISAQSLYRATDLLLPEELNQEGKEIEAVAVAVRAWDLYATLAGDAWGARAENDALAWLPSPAYSFTSMVAFARLYSAVYAPGDLDSVEAIVSKAMSKLGLPARPPVDMGSGERAASVLASMAAATVPKNRLRASKLAA